MEKLFYPAIFHKTEDNGFWVSYPDFPECLTEGHSMENAYDMAVDALGIVLSYMEEQKEKIPKPTSPDMVYEEDGYVVIIEFDMSAYRKRTSSRAVKKTLTIPEWLNERAMAMGINFSQVLQDALIKQLENK